MSIIVSGIKKPYHSTDSDAIGTAVSLCGLTRKDVISASIHKLSFDLRGGALHKVYSVELKLDADENAFCQRLNRQNVRCRHPAEMPDVSGHRAMTDSPVVCGFGPTGMFCALLLAEKGYRPIVLERGDSMDERDRAVNAFFSGGPLDTNSNIQFGEGGAGTYSDGKLTTRIGDPLAELVLKLLRQHGAPAEIMTSAHPHIGTDVLKGIVVSIRKRIEQLGGKVLFRTAVTGLVQKDGRITAVKSTGGEFACQLAILAIGHSARDTFAALLDEGIAMQPKPFSVGVRIEHRQETIDQGLYGKYAGLPGLPRGEYFLSRRVGERGCYSFCMCPGGTVVAAASEQGMVVTNGMSLHARDGENANAALCVSVTPADFGVSGPLGGVAFQRRLERAAYAAGGGDFCAPVQCVGDFLRGQKSNCLGKVMPSYPRGWEMADLNGILPPVVAGLLRDSIVAFGRKLPLFDSADAVMTGLETRTSSPVRLTRGEDLFSLSLSGLIPCGEGAGYAGGIVSAAVDGLRAARRIMQEYLPLE